MERGQRLERGTEAVGVGIADARHPIPVIARRARQRQRGAGRHQVQPPLGVKRVAEPEHVSLVGSAAVVEHQQPGGIPRSGPLAEAEAGRHGERASSRVARPSIVCWP